MIFPLSESAQFGSCASLGQAASAFKHKLLGSKVASDFR